MIRALPLGVYIRAPQVQKLPGPPSICTLDQYFARCSDSGTLTYTCSKPHVNQGPTEAEDNRVRPSDKGHQLRTRIKMKALQRDEWGFPKIQGPILGVALRLPNPFMLLLKATLMTNLLPQIQNFLNTVLNGANTYRNQRSPAGLAHTTLEETLILKPV